MPGVVECAVLLHPAREDWLDAWMTRCFTASPRLRLHAYELTQADDGSPNVNALRDASLLLRRYDTAILPISYASLSWARTALAGVERQRALPIPLMALVKGLLAPAIQDLFALGVADFLREDDSLDDLRVRLSQMACARGPAARVGWKKACGETNDSAWLDVDAEMHHAPMRLAEPSRQACPTGAQNAWPDADETFRTAKKRVVACFERDYIARALSRHAGNISMAARSAQKHRRAFWALMHKHQIDAAAYRQSPTQLSGGDSPGP